MLIYIHVLAAAIGRPLIQHKTLCYPFSDIQKSNPPRRRSLGNDDVDQRMIDTTGDFLKFDRSKKMIDAWWGLIARSPIEFFVLASPYPFFSRFHFVIFSYKAIYPEVLNL